MANRKRTDEVLATARKELQAQLALVRDEMSRLAAEERALTDALSSLDGGSSASSRTSKAGGGAAATGSRRSSTRKSAKGRRRRGSGQSKSTADRLDELTGLLAGGPKSRTDLAAALNVSPARVQQLLAALGSSVTSQPNPEQRQGKLWSLKGSGGASGATRGSAGKDGSARKTPSRAKETAS